MHTPYTVVNVEPENKSALETCGPDGSIILKFILNRIWGRVIGFKWLRMYGSSVRPCAYGYTL